MYIKTLKKLIIIVINKIIVTTFIAFLFISYTPQYNYKIFVKKSKTK